MEPRYRGKPASGCRAIIQKRTSEATAVRQIATADLRLSAFHTDSADNTTIAQQARSSAILST